MTETLGSQYETPKRATVALLVLFLCLVVVGVVTVLVPALDPPGGNDGQKPAAATPAAAR